MVCRSYTVSFRPTFLASARVPPHSLLPLIADAALRVNSHDGRAVTSAEVFAGRSAE